ncbi:MAG TPA: CheR family methyltransferase [Terriglobia bacterium]
MKVKTDARQDARIDIETELLLEAIYRKYHYDFRGYVRPPLQRRLAEALPKFGCRTLSALQDRLIHDPMVLSAVLDRLTIQFSEMFRDPSYFRSLREDVMPILRTYPSLKVWCAGCGSGEEAYSLAILFREEGLLERTTIYATDINRDALRKAEAGIYNIERMPAFSRNYQQTGASGSLSDYYTAAYGAVTLDKSLQRHILFADHSLATDQVFSEVHFVSCRNVLIYFDRELQSHCFGLFDESLCHRGFLGLGAQETLRSAKWANRFEPVAVKDRIFRKIR